MAEDTLAAWIANRARNAATKRLKEMYPVEYMILYEQERDALREANEYKDGRPDANRKRHKA